MNSTPAKPKLSTLQWITMPFAFAMSLRRYITPLGWFCTLAIVMYTIITIWNQASTAIFTIVFHGDFWQFVQSAGPLELTGALGHAFLLFLIHSGGTIALVVASGAAFCLILGLIYAVTHGTANPFRLFIRLY